MFAVNGFPFHSYKAGDIFGDNDCFMSEPRDSKSASATQCILFSINYENLAELLTHHPEQ